MVKEKPKTRINILYSGAAADRLYEATDLLGFDNHGDTIRYLAQRGMDTLTQQLQTKRFLRDLEKKLDPQQMLEFLESKELK